MEHFLYLKAPEPQWKEPSRARSIRRARTALIRKINANAGQWWDARTDRFHKPLFFTFTFEENVTDIPTANKAFSLFTKRLNYDVLGTKKATLRYLTVIEFQKRGAVHYHALFFNVPFTVNLHTRLKKAWSHGHVWYETVKNVKNVGAYVAKYMSKEFDDPRLHGKKLYFGSRGLLKPLVERDSEYVEIYYNLDKILEFSYDTLVYSKYWIGNSPLRLLNTSKPVDNSEIPQRIQGNFWS